MRFILNRDIISTDVNPATSLLDFLRRNQNLKGTKEGCREGDCGACTVLIGESEGNNINYHNANSCLIPIADMEGKHVITIEGLNISGLTLFQKEIVEEGGTQCGFCTPGFIVSFTGYLMNSGKYNLKDAIESVGGNICRCTGHGTIRRAVSNVLNYFETTELKKGENRIKYLSRLNAIPDYISDIPLKLKKIERRKKVKALRTTKGEPVCGGTDIFVQKWDELLKKKISVITKSRNINGIKTGKNICSIKASTTVTEIEESKELNKMIPGLKDYMLLFGSLPIKNRASIGGNINNASPIGDMTNIFLALNSKLILKKKKAKREIFLKDYYKGYKSLDRKKGELIDEIKFTIPGKNTKFNFEKVSKRTFLDIVSVNSSILIKIKNDIIEDVHISAGGVAPIPFHLTLTSEFLKSKLLSPKTVKKSIAYAMKEISPISDARGSADYKRLLLRQLIYAHFLKLFPEVIKPEDLLYE